jgi:acyl-coenzyme A thioesterase PaaI-like protein
LVSEEKTYFQDGLHGNHCFGCGAWNERGLRIRSFWDGDESVCIFEPQPHHAAMPPDVVNGGILASVIDCHSVCTAIADAYRREGREVGEGPKIWYATGSLQVNYRKPTPVAGPFTVRSKIVEASGKKTSLTVRLFGYDGVMTCDGSVLAVRVPEEWADPEGLFKHLKK